MSDIRIKMAKDLRDMSDMVGDLHWMAAKAVEDLIKKDGEIAKRDVELSACRASVENCEVFRARIVELEAKYLELASLSSRVSVELPIAYAAPVSEAKAHNRCLDEVARLNAAPVQQVSVPASAFASRAITHYEAALLAAFPSGSSGEVFNQWNEARRVLAAAPAVPSQGEQVRVVPVEPTEAMRKAAQDKLASEGLIVTDWLIHTAYSAMLANAPSPAGVDGLNTDRNAAFKACPESGCDWGSFYLGWKARGEVEQAIIDGLRAEIGAQRVKTCIALKERNDAREERDQQAQRIGELASHLEFAVTMLTVAGLDENAQVEAMRAALSAGKEGE